ncbi:Heterogeneous nuclear ribonucleoprotein like [Melia azedarach]|uniref:Heterogeneous nuclear ribonucleoprotein like n=1 Tax=Melia azedarach TaxID=155640 RepID=A0ACC1Y997_MELAZ|nr:Heterogeneous nuclear ribonucleoprotein like [Melia azedarach]
MAESTEVEERVDLDEDNYMEEMDDDVEEQIDDDGEGGGDGNVEENDEEEEYEYSKSGPNEKDQSPEANRNHNDTEHVEDEDKPGASISEDEKEKHAQLLALPPNGSEVFIGGLPKDASEENLRDLCEPIGEVFEVRLMKDKDSGESKGFAFVAFKSKEVAKKAIDELHSKEFKGKTIRCSLSETKNRLFVGNVPKIWTEDEFRKVIEGVGPGVETIELIKDPQNSSRNRGFAFVLYYNNACADYSRQKMTNANFKLDGNTPTVTWADPKSTPDHSAAASQVKALYVKNIPDNTSTEQLKELFQRHGEVTKVVMPPGKSGKRDFGFIHYAERSSALKAVKDTEKYEIDGQVLEVVLAKPQTEKKPEGGFPYGAGVPPNHLPHAGYGGFAGAPYGAVGAGFGVAASFQQPMIYGRGPMPAGMHMVPMVLPDGRIGYVLQQPGVQMPPPPRPRRVDRGSGPGGHGGRAGGSGGEDGNRGRRYRPY